MEIKDNRTNPKDFMEIQHVQYGFVFEHDDRFYIRNDRIYTDMNGKQSSLLEHGVVIATDLKYGAIHGFDKSTIVHVIKMEGSITQ
jgi:hypothetical protein